MYTVKSQHCQRKREAWIHSYGEAFLKIYRDGSLSRQEQVNKLNLLGIPTVTNKLNVWSIPTAQQTYKRMFD